MPLLRMAMYAKGIQLLLRADRRRPRHLAVDDAARRARRTLLRASARASTCAAPTAQPDYAAIQGDDPATVLMRGGSAIIGPLGQVLAGPVYNEDAILTAEIDLGEVTRSRNATSTSSATMRGPTSSGCT